MQGDLVEITQIRSESPGTLVIVRFAPAVRRYNLKLNIKYYQII